MATTSISSIQFKRGKKATLISKLVGENKPRAGEPVFETDTGKLKIGNGTDDYVNLPYMSGDAPVESQLIFKTTYDLPSVGTPNVLYIIEDERNAYFWDSAKNNYSLMSVDSRKIDGGEADTIYY